MKKKKKKNTVANFENESNKKAHDFYEIIKNSLKLMWRRMRKFLRENDDDDQKRTIYINFVHSHNTIYLYFICGSTFIEYYILVCIEAQLGLVSI